jgi:hypothetical protein
MYQTQQAIAPKYNIVKKRELFPLYADSWWSIPTKEGHATRRIYSLSQVNTKGVKYLTH